MHRVRLGLESSRNRLSLTVTDTLLLLRHVQDGPLPNEDGERLLEFDSKSVCVFACWYVCLTGNMSAYPQFDGFWTPSWSQGNHAPRALQA